jgi:hypothetical protein
MQMTMTFTFDDVSEASLFMAKLSTAFAGLGDAIKSTARAAATAVLAPAPAVEPPKVEAPAADPTTLERSYLAKLGDKVNNDKDAVPQVEATTSVPSAGDTPKRRGRKPRHDEPAGYEPKETAAPAAAEAAPEKAAEPKVAAPAPKQVSVDDLRLLVQQVVKKQGPQAVYAILNKYGAARLPDLAEDKIPEVYTKMHATLIDDVIPF